MTKTAAKTAKTTAAAAADKPVAADATKGATRARAKAEPAKATAAKAPAKPRSAARVKAAAAAAIAAAVMVSVPVAAMEVDELNVRRSPPSAQGIEELAAQIAATGFHPIQNLVGRHLDGGRVGIVAGGRRLRALRHLAEAGLIPADHAVVVRIVSDDDAHIVSLAENTREALPEADLIRAFGDMLDGAMTPERIAAAFGYTPAYVTRMGRLAKMHPALLDGLTAGAITVEHLRVLSTIDDADEQAATWARASEHAIPDVAALRRIVLGDGAVSTAPVASFVGLRAYREAGGGVAQDLFAQPGDPQRLTDAALLAKLAGDKLVEQARAIFGEGVAFVEPRIGGFAAMSAFELPADFVRAPTVEATPDEASVERHASAKAAMVQAADALAQATGAGDGANLTRAALAAIEAGETAPAEAARAFLAASLDYERAKLGVAARVVHPAAAKHAGVLVGVDAAGALTHIAGVVLRSQSSAVLRAVRKAEAAERAAQGSPEATPGAGAAREQASGDVLSGSAIRALTVATRDAMRAAMLDNPEAAVRVAAWQMARSSLGVAHQRGALDAGMSIKADARGAAIDAGPKAAKAAAVLDTQRSAVEALMGSPNQGLSWFMTAPMAAVHGVIAFATAIAYSPSQPAGLEDSETTRAIMAAVGFQAAGAWDASAEFFALMPKTASIAAAHSVGGHTAAAPLVKMTRAEAATAAAAAVAGGAWVPPELVAKAPAQPVAVAAHVAAAGDAQVVGAEHGDAVTF